MTAHPPAGSALRKPLRLWPGVALGVLILVLRYLPPQIAPRLFEPDTALNVTLFGFFGALLASVLVLLWWLLFSRAPWVDRLLALGLVAVGFLAGPLVQDVSITAGAMGLLYPILVIPIVALAFVAWAALTQHLSDGVRRKTMAAAILLAFASVGLIRHGRLHRRDETRFRLALDPDAGGAPARRGGEHAPTGICLGTGTGVGIRARRRAGKRARGRPLVHDDRRALDSGAGDTGLA